LPNIVVVDSEALRAWAAMGLETRVLDKELFLFRSKKVVSVVIFRPTGLGKFARNWVAPVLLTANPRGNDDVFSNVPLDE
jgi:hypothetical protein